MEEKLKNMDPEKAEHLKKMGLHKIELPSKEKYKVLMVCVGNICRSPMAEAVFRRVAKELGVSDRWEVDSAALYDYHTGSGPDNRAMKTLREKGIDDYEHKARMITREDYNTFDFIFGMDDSIMETLEESEPRGCKAQLHLLGKWNPDGDDQIEDPYYQRGCAAFIKNYEQIDKSCRLFLEYAKLYQEK